MSVRRQTPAQILRRTVERLNAQLQWTQNAQRDSDREIRRVRQRMQSEMAQALRSQERRNKQMADQTRQEMRQIERNMQNQINGVWTQMQDGFQAAFERDQQLQDNIEQVQREALDRDRQLQRNIDRVREEMHRGQVQLQKQINSINARHANASQAASSWCKEANHIVEHIRENLRHDKFAPGALANIDQKLQLAISNLNTKGLENAALSGAQGAYLEAQHLRLQIEAAEAEWQARVNSAKGLALQLEAEWELNRNPRFQFETEKGNQELEGSVDDWTGGEYGKVKEQLDSVLAQLNKPESLSLDQVKALETQSAELQQEQIRVINLARQAIIASQLRVDMATIVAETLQQQGWHVVDSAYEGEEQTNTLHVKFVMGQDEMVITITPKQTRESVTNTVETTFFDRTTNDVEFRASRMASIESALASIEGVECGESQCVPGTNDMSTPDPNLLDFEKIKQRKSQRQASRKRQTTKSAKG